MASLTLETIHAIPPRQVRASLWYGQDRFHLHFSLFLFSRGMGSFHLAHIRPAPGNTTGFFSQWIVPAAPWIDAYPSEKFAEQLLPLHACLHLQESPADVLARFQPLLDQIDDIVPSAVQSRNRVAAGKPPLPHTRSPSVRSRQGAALSPERETNVIPFPGNRREDRRKPAART